MKHNLLINYINSKKANKPLNEKKSSHFNFDFFHNKLLKNAIESNIFFNGYISLSNTRSHYYFKKKEKSMNHIFSSDNKRNNSSKNKTDLTPRTIFNSVNSDKRETKRYSFKSKNLSSINISDNSYNFHKEQNEIINSDKKLLIYFNKNNLKEEENLSYNTFKHKNFSENILNKYSAKDKKDYLHKKLTKSEFIKSKLFESNNDKKVSKTLRPKIDKKIQVIIPSQSAKNISKISQSTTTKEDTSKFVQLIKNKAKNYFIEHRFSSVKDYFNDWLYYKRKKDYQKKLYLDVDSIYYYLKDKIGIKIFKNQVSKIFNCNNTVFDINQFKDFFFEENSGQKSLLINKKLLLNNNLFNSYNYFKKNKGYSFSSFSDIIKSTKTKNPIFKNNLLIRVLKENKSKIIDKICDNLVENDKKEEYDFTEFNNLFEQLNLDKNVVNKKMTKKLFNKYKNKNEKVNIKYFINNLESIDDDKNELFKDKEENKENMIETPRRKAYHKFFYSNPINLHLNKIQFKDNNEDNNKTKSSPINKIEKYSFKSNTLTAKVEKNINNTSQTNKLIKFNELKKNKKLKKKKFCILFDSGAKSMNQSNMIKSIKPKFIKSNDNKTIKVENKFRTNYNHNITLKEIDKNIKKFATLTRPVSVYNKAFLEMNINKNKNNSNYIDNRIQKLFSEDSKIQKLNSDIIDLI